MNTRHTNTLETVANLLLALLIFFLPLQTRWIISAGTLNNGPWEYGTFSLYATDLLLICFFAVAWIVIIRRRETARWTLSTLLACFFLAIAFVSTSVAKDHATSLFWFLQLAKGVLLCTVVIHFPVRRRWIASAVILSAVLQSILAWAQFLSQQVIATTWLGIAAQFPATPGVQVIETASGRILRAYGSLSHPNMLAGFLVVALLVCLSIYMTHQKNLFRVPYAAALCLLAAALWTTFSRQGVIGLAVALTVLIAISFLHTRVFPKELFFGIVYIVLPLVLLSATFPEMITHRLQSDTRLEQQSINEREHYLDQTTVLLREQWVTGVGIGSFTAATHLQDTKKFITKDSHAYQPVHNIFLLIFAELGVFGMLTFLLFLVSLWHGRTILSGRLPWMLALIALLTIGFFDHYLWSLPFGITLFWLVAALFYIAGGVTSPTNDVAIK